jgi:hypothetical protein
MLLFSRFGAIDLGWPAPSRVPKRKSLPRLQNIMNKHTLRFSPYIVLFVWDQAASFDFFGNPKEITNQASSREVGASGPVFAGPGGHAELLEDVSTPPLLNTKVTGTWVVHWGSAHKVLHCSEIPYNRDDGLPDRRPSAGRLEVESDGEHGGGTFPLQHFPSPSKISFRHNSVRLISKL